MDSTVGEESTSLIFQLNPWCFQKYHSFMHAALLNFLSCLKLSLEFLRNVPRYLKSSISSSFFLPQINLLFHGFSIAHQVCIWFYLCLRINQRTLLPVGDYREVFLHLQKWMRVMRCHLQNPSQSKSMMGSYVCC
jgi:hypothetical protein